MKNEKMSLANMQEKLSRKEMKTIMAGSGSGLKCIQCTGNSDCSYSRECTGYADCGPGNWCKRIVYA